MAREHRYLKDGQITIVPFTVAEEALADQWEADRLAREQLEATPDYRISKALTLSDKDRVIFEAFFELANRLQALEGKASITRVQLKAWLQAKLP